MAEQENYFPLPPRMSAAEIEATLASGPMGEPIDHWTETLLDALLDWAYYEVGSCYQRLREAGEAHGESGQGNVRPRIRMANGVRATNGAFQIEWTTFRYASIGGKARRLDRLIPKGQGDRYPARAFTGRLRTWQQPIVQAYERRFARIRVRIRLVSEVRTAYRRAVREFDAYVLGDEDGQEETAPNRLTAPAVVISPVDHAAILAREGIVERPRQQASSPTKRGTPKPEGEGRATKAAVRPAAQTPDLAPRASATSAKPKAARPQPAARPPATPPQQPQPQPKAAASRPKRYRDRLDEHTLPDFEGELEELGLKLPPDLRPPRT